MAARKISVVPENLPTEEQVARFDMLVPLLNSAFEEMSEFAKKKQDGVLNPLKVKLLNRLLCDVKAVLESDPTTAYLDLLDEETLPQNTDAVLILGQYRGALQQFRQRFYGRETRTDIEQRWFTKEHPGTPIRL